MDRLKTNFFHNQKLSSSLSEDGCGEEYYIFASTEEQH